MPIQLQLFQKLYSWCNIWENLFSIVYANLTVFFPFLLVINYQFVFFYYCVFCFLFYFSVYLCFLLFSCSPVSTRRWADVVLLLGQPLRRWPNINPKSGERLMSVGSDDNGIWRRADVEVNVCTSTRAVCPMLGWGWTSVVDDGSTSSQHWPAARVCWL